MSDQSRPEAEQRAGEAAALRRRSMQTLPAFREGPGFLSSGQQFWLNWIQDAVDQGRWCTHPGSGPLRAHAGLRRYFDQFLNSEIISLFFDYAPGDEEARAWTQEQIRNLVTDLPAEEASLLTANFPACHTTELPVLREAGLAVAELILGGDPRESARLLLKKYPWFNNTILINERLPTGPADLRCRPLRDESEALAAADIHHEVFTESPWLNWVYGSPGYAEKHREQLVAMLPGERMWGLFQNKILRGFFYYGAEERNDFWGPLANMDFGFGRSVRGLGLAPMAYKVMFDKMALDRIHFYKGGTANAAVLALGGVMHRPLLSVFMRHSSLCPDQARFERYLR